MKRKLQALMVLLLLGGVKIPVEVAMSRQLREDRLLNPPLKVEVKAQLGQMAVAASLGGLRSLVASVYYLRATLEWERVNWGAVESIFWVVTRLQPRFPNYWDEGSWHLAYNASSFYNYSMKLSPEIRGNLRNAYIERGIQMLKDGLEYLPDEARLWHSLAAIYDQRLMDYEKAAECYLQVFRLSKNQRYLRFAAYDYAQTTDPVLWQKAYEILKTGYDKGQRQPTLIDLLKTLEERLKVPLLKRIPDPRPDVPHRLGEMGPMRQ